MGIISYDKFNVNEAAKYKIFWHAEIDDDDRGDIKIAAHSSPGAAELASMFDVVHKAIPSATPKDMRYEHNNSANMVAHIVINSLDELVACHRKLKNVREALKR